MNFFMFCLVVFGLKVKINNKNVLSYQKEAEDDLL